MGHPCILSNELWFPPADEADEFGIVAVGGDLSVERLLLAYRSGIFPWPHDDAPLLWFSPDPRLLIDPDHIRVSKSLQRTLKSGKFAVSFNSNFVSVIQHCSRVPRTGQDGTWISPDMIEAYCRLHFKGHAHSVEVWESGSLVGGLYGVRVGAIFCGESMFSIVPDASKVALVHLARSMIDTPGAFIDCQLPTPHLVKMGGIEVSRAEYLRLLAAQS